MSDPATAESRRLVYLAQLAMVVMGAAAFVWLLTMATPILLPIVFALVIGVVFAPLSDQVDRMGAPPFVAALLVLFIVLSFIVAGVLIFYPVIAEFSLRLPLLWYEVEELLSGIKSTMESVDDVQKRLSDTLSANGSEVTGQAEVEAEASDGGMQVPTARDLLARLPSIASQCMIFVGILYFFLLGRFDIYRAVGRNSRKLSTEALCRAEKQVSRYFLTVTAINASFGVLATLAFSALGMPNAMYWGLGAFLVNYILYLGPILFAITLLGAGIVLFDGAMSFVPAAVYLAMNMTEGQFVTPSLVGRHMKVNPLLVFVSLVFWMWVWGPVGAVIAIPVMVWLRQVNKSLVRTPAPDTEEAEGLPHAFGAALNAPGLDPRNMETPHGPAQ